MPGYPVPVIKEEVEVPLAYSGVYGTPYLHPKLVTPAHAHSAAPKDEDPNDLAKRLEDQESVNKFHSPFYQHELRDKISKIPVKTIY